MSTFCPLITSKLRAHSWWRNSKWRPALKRGRKYRQFFEYCRPPLWRSEPEKRTVCKGVTGHPNKSEMKNSEAALVSCVDIQWYTTEQSTVDSISWFISFKIFIVVNWFRKMTFVMCAICIWRMEKVQWYFNKRFHDQSIVNVNSELSPILAITDSDRVLTPIHHFFVSNSRDNAKDEVIFTCYSSSIWTCSFSSHFEQQHFLHCSVFV